MYQPSDLMEKIRNTFKPERPDKQGAENKSALNNRHGIALYVEGLTVSFDGFKALNDLNLYLETGELRCIIGPNGAGKTTLMDVITGRTRPDAGTVYYGKNLDVTCLNEYQIAQAGIGRKFQRPTIFPSHTVFENLELAMQADKRVFKDLFAVLNGEDHDRIESILDTIGMVELMGQRAGLLSHGQKQWLEIGMLLMQNPKVLLLDEPVAGMTQQEIEKTADLFNSLVPQHTVVVVEHDMDFVRRIARKVTVLHEGSVLAEGDMDTVRNDPLVKSVYLGD